jgi:hypothetical protein
MWKPLSQPIVFIAACLFTLSSAALGHAESVVEKTPPPQSQVATPETPPATQTAALPATLSPDMFTGTAREAYQVATEIPEVLNELNCHCGCKRSQGHANLLHCFTDGHAAG